MAVAQRFMNQNDGIVVTGHHQLLEDIRQVVREEIASQMKPDSKDQIMTLKEAARFMGESRQTFMKKFTIHTSQGGYPLSLMHGKGRCKKFLKSELEAYFKKS